MADAGGMKVTGLNETSLYLKNFERDIFDTLSEQVKAILKVTAASAKGRYPGGAFTTRFGTAKWPAGVIQTAGGSARGIASWADAPPGAKAAIFDQLGRRSAGATPQVRATIASLDDRYGAPQRFLWPAWLDNRDQSMTEIQRAFDAAERALQSKLDGA